MADNGDIPGDLQRQADTIAPEGIWVPTPDQANEQQAMEKVNQQLLRSLTFRQGLRIRPVVRLGGGPTAGGALLVEA